MEEGWERKALYGSEGREWTLRRHVRRRIGREMILIEVWSLSMLIVHEGSTLKYNPGV
jgi:hypothetical protein